MVSVGRQHLYLPALGDTQADVGDSKSVGRAQKALVTHKAPVQV